MVSSCSTRVSSLLPPSLQALTDHLFLAVGFVYTAKAKHYLASTGMLWGIGGLYHSATNSMHVLRETVSTVRAALELKTVFEELAKAETEGITEDRKKELEEEAATKG